VQQPLKYYAVSTTRPGIAHSDPASHCACAKIFRQSPFPVARDGCNSLKEL
jgi:hypothetical protein